MTSYFAPINSSIKNNGIACEWAVCAHYGIERSTHDNSSYDKNSDLNVGDKHISIKSNGFTLMSGSLCEGLTDFDEIWNLYESKTHSNTFAYMTSDSTVYEMNLIEFKSFVYNFCGLEKESEKNGGALKIRCRKESKKMTQWLRNQLPA